MTSLDTMFSMEIANRGLNSELSAGENAQRRAGEIRWNGENFEGYNGNNWIPFTMSYSIGGYV